MGINLYKYSIASAVSGIIDCFCPWFNILSQHQDIVDIEKDFESGYFASKYGKMHYKHHKGSGARILFLHGFAGSVKSWSRLMQHIDGDLDIYLLDLLGHGDSEVPEADYSFSMHYDSVLQFVDGNIDGEFYAFGHSYGGWIAARCAMDRNILGLILEDSAGLREFMEDRYMANPNYREELVSKAVQINPRKDVLEAMVNADNKDEYLTRENLAEIKARTLIIWGGKDVTVKPMYSKIFKDCIQGSNLVVLESEKHTPHYSNPEAVARLLDGFILK